MIREAIQFHGGRMERNSQQLVMTEKSKYGMEFPAMKLSRLKLEIHGFLKQFIIHTAIGWLRQQEGNLDCGTPIAKYFMSPLIILVQSLILAGARTDLESLLLPTMGLRYTFHISRNNLGNTVGRDLV